eukprot:scaffold91114_cov64-Phaeocystis_antarctica.AAC.11
MAAPERREPLTLLRPNSSTGGQLSIPLRISSDLDLLSGGAHAFHETCVALTCVSSARAPFPVMFILTACPKTAVLSPELTPSCVALTS